MLCFRRKDYTIVLFKKVRSCFPAMELHSQRISSICPKLFYFFFSFHLSLPSSFRPSLFFPFVLFLSLPFISFLVFSSSSPSFSFFPYPFPSVSFFSQFRCGYFHNKTVPLQAWSGPEGSRKLRFPDFVTTAQDDGKVVSLKHRPPLPPGNTRGTHFC